jgi:hypothetical protein
MHDEPPPRELPERTGKHYCVTCLAPVPADEYFANDHICTACALKESEKEAGDEPRRRRP